MRIVDDLEELLAMKADVMAPADLATKVAANVDDDDDTALANSIWTAFRGTFIVCCNEKDCVGIYNYLCRMVRYFRTILLTFPF